MNLLWGKVNWIPEHGQFFIVYLEYWYFISYFSLGVVEKHKLGLTNI